MALLVVFTTHDVLAKLLYARGGGSGAQLLFYGGDVIEVLTAVVLFGRWYVRVRPRPGRAPLTHRRRDRSPAGRG